MSLSEKAIKRYLRLAATIGNDSNSCHSRHIGSVVVNAENGHVVGIGINGPPRQCPEIDSYPFYMDYLNKAMTDDERAKFIAAAKERSGTDCNSFHAAAVKMNGCKLCPRKILGYPSGQRLDLCPCVHSESNAIVNAASATEGCWIIMACLLSCLECTKLIINAGIKRVICLKSPQDYSIGSRWLFKQAKVIVEIRDPDTLEIVEYV